MRTRDFGMGFFGRMHFGADARKEMFDKWSTMTDEEKLALMNRHMEAMNGDEHCKREFSVAAIDQRCEEWMKKTQDEKEAFIKEHKEMMNHFREHAGGFGHGRGFGFGCCEESAEKEAEAK